MIPAIISGAASLIGSGLDFISGAKSQSNAHEANNAAQQTLAQTAGYADQMRDQGNQVLLQMLNANQGIFGTPEQARLALLQAQQNLGNVDFQQVNPYDAGQFSYRKDLEDFYDNALGLRMNAANDAINGSQALGGNLFSSDTANKLTAQAQVLGSEAYKDAMEAYTADKGLEANIWNANEQAKQAAAESAANVANMNNENAFNLAKAQYDMAGDTAGNIANAQNDFYSALMGLNDDYWQNRSDFVAQVAGLQGQDPGGNWLTWMFG